MTRILLVEDEMLVRELAFDDLSAAGFEVVAATHGDEALRILADDRGFDLLFTDIRMPGELDGWELAARAKQLIPGLKVVFATGLHDGAGEVGPDERLATKPYCMDSLLSLFGELGVAH